jgi:hypothetical protein
MGSTQLEAFTIQKSFRTAFDPMEPFLYEDLPALVS